MGNECGDCKRIKELEEELELVKFELKRLREERYKKKKKKEKPSGKDKSSKSKPKKRGGVFGHLGWFRKKPKKIDRIEKVKLKECPECGGRHLKKCKKKDEHVQEDIVLPKVEAVLYRKDTYYCYGCKKVVSGKGKDELPGSYIGPKAKALAVFMKYGIKISERDIKNLFSKAFNLNIVHSSISGFKNQLREKAAPIYNMLLSALKKGKFIHADETGWKIDGANAWLWKFSNKKICVTHIDESRGQKVVEKILGKEYEGVLLSDFLSAYNKIETEAKQRCLVHLLRDLKKVIEFWHDDKEVLRYCRRLKKILQDAIKLYKKYKDKKWDRQYCLKRERIQESLKDFNFPNPDKKILQRFAKRLNRHKDELFVFLYKKGIDFHNNHIEQQIRPDVLFRKITFGNRSYSGVKNHNVLMSVLQTARLNGLDPIKTFRNIFAEDKNNPFLKILTPT